MKLISDETDKLSMESENKNSYIIPLAVIIAGVLVAGAILYSRSVRPYFPQASLVRNDRTLQAPPPPVIIAGDVDGITGIDRIRPIHSEDHILGNPEAPVKVVEFADTECPFCKSFHPTMHQLIREYGLKGQVAWVYRHFPIDAIHPKARAEAEALECANELGGNGKFWAYTDRIYEITPSNNNLDLNELPRIAEYVGLNPAQFEACLSQGKYARHIQEDLDDATNSGGQGTPHNVVIAANGKKFPISGAQPYAALKSVVDLALQEK